MGVNRSCLVFVVDVGRPLVWVRVACMYGNGFVSVHTEEGSGLVGLGVRACEMNARICVEIVRRLAHQFQPLGKLAPEIWTVAVLQHGLAEASQPTAGASDGHACVGGAAPAPVPPPHTTRATRRHRWVAREAARSRSHGRGRHGHERGRGRGRHAQWPLQTFALPLPALALAPTASRRTAQPNLGPRRMDAGTWRCNTRRAHDCLLHVKVWADWGEWLTW
eukprot:SAG11_NODE_4039_length_2093_cov_1.322969_3_plen_221_part_00